MSINEKKAFFGKAIKEETRISSSSGGIFPVLACEIINNKGYVWGAAFEGIGVKHRCVSDIKDLNIIQRSKYVQSDIKEVYKQILSQLKSGKSVLFSGTACQINALDTFLNKKVNTDKLLLIEIVCHGVPSPKVWEKYLEQLSNERNKSIEDITNIQFKYKDNKQYSWDHPGFLVEWNADVKYIDYSNNTWYENGFLGNLFVRPSCHRCVFKNFNTNADIIIGDFWGCKKIYPEFFDSKGVSILFTNSLKGNNFLNKCKDKIELHEISIKEAIAYNERICNSSIASRNRKKFWNSFLNMEALPTDNSNYSEIIEKYTRISFLERVSRKIKRILKKL